MSECVCVRERERARERERERQREGRQIERAYPAAWELGLMPSDSRKL